MHLIFQLSYHHANLICYMLHGDEAKEHDTEEALTVTFQKK